MFSWSEEHQSDARYYLDHGGCAINYKDFELVRVYKGGVCSFVLEVKDGHGGKVEFQEIKEFKNFLGIKDFLKVKRNEIFEPVDCLIVGVGLDKIIVICDSSLPGGYLEMFDLGYYRKRNKKSLVFYESKIEEQLSFGVQAIETLQNELGRCKKYLEDPWKEYKATEARFKEILKKKEAATKYKIEETKAIVEVLGKRIEAGMIKVVEENFKSGERK